MHDVTRVVMPAGIEHSITVATAGFIACPVILFEAGSALFLRLCPAFFISHNLLSFRLLLLFLLHHPRTTRRGGKPCLCQIPFGQASSPAIRSFEVDGSARNPSELIAVLEPVAVTRG